MSRPNYLWNGIRCDSQEIVTNAKYVCERLPQRVFQSCATLENGYFVCRNSGKWGLSWALLSCTDLITRATLSLGTANLFSRVTADSIPFQSYVGRDKSRKSQSAFAKGYKASTLRDNDMVGNINVHQLTRFHDFARNGGIFRAWRRVGTGMVMH